ncbi:hypothetical protein A2333_00460 [Candidatus Wolfebacteria bacterium RIFOXYB2_FULL_49_7]|uniref:Uncharacterized protein n=1 Tax=Candidatus Wolfebacteria bacterium RIFOXYB1_FULL_54_12 TaxID=1802559 RepID=A0A1F8DXA9_9BACT|nr:MAG: hypothetical protein A2372_02170 [Candidatus Wolfebacteria bacterium RIFOXYB1_FULL_54_12]OGM95902.1 MAG: hypothetical protein A2333_00460 [Candidatus Wolfebacteria bacterium RIFOXYB2_FULL_49_7]
MIEKHNERKKEVVDFINDVIRDINSIFLCDYPSSPRIQAIIVFSLLDILASYWYEYDGKCETQSKRFTSWLRTFCLIGQNVEYVKNTRWHKLSSERLWHLRNSLVHFFGLSNESDGIYMALASNKFSDKEVDEYESGINKLGESLVIMVKPKDLYELIKQGGILMLKDWIKNIHEAQAGNNERGVRHIDGIERIYKKIQSEGAKLIPM